MVAAQQRGQKVARVYAPTPTKAAWPMEIRPANPVSRFRPYTATMAIRMLSMTSMYLLPTSNTSGQTNSSRQKTDKNQAVDVRQKYALFRFVGGKKITRG